MRSDKHKSNKKTLKNETGYELKSRSNNAKKRTISLKEIKKFF